MTKFIKDGYVGRVPMAFCPFCFWQLDAATNMEGPDAPQPGDFTVCIECAGVLQYGPDMQLLASSLLEVPMHSRLSFAKVVQTIKTLRPHARYNPTNPQ